MKMGHEHIVVSMVNTRGTACEHKAVTGEYHGDSEPTLFGAGGAFCGDCSKHIIQGGVL